MARRTLKKKTPQIGGEKPPRPIFDKNGEEPTCPMGYELDNGFSIYDKINPRYSCKPSLSNPLGFAAHAMNQLMSPGGAGGLAGGLVGSALGGLGTDGGTSGSGSGMTMGIRLIGGHHQQSRSRHRRRHRRLRRIQSWKYRSTPTSTTRHRRRHRV